VRRVFGLGLQRLDHDRLDLLICDRPWPARPRLIQEPLKPLGRKPVAPFRYRRARHALQFRDLLVRQMTRRGQHDPSAQRQRLRGLAARVHASSTDRS
jgi:hypothetical protein